MESRRDRKRKDSVSINACIGAELFSRLSELCAVTGQSKTVALERAITEYCSSGDDSEGSGNE